MRPGPEWFIWIETLGILSFAFNAMIVAKGKGVSPLGVFLCAALTALGGGTVRDLLLGPQAQPFFWVAFPFYIVAVFALSVAYARTQALRAVIARRDRVIKEGAEALAMASLGALGAAKAYNILAPLTIGLAGAGTLHAAQLLILCATMGVVSAALGGVIRDVLLNEFPGVLRPGVQVLESLFLGSVALVLLRLAGVEPPWALLGGFLVILVLRVWTVTAASRARA